MTKLKTAFHKEQSALERYMGEELVDLCKASNAIIAGGAITSIFTDKEINDLDVYFRTFEDMEVFIRNAYGETSSLATNLDLDLPEAHLWCISHTPRSILFTCGERKVQVIHFKLFPEGPNEIFQSFDFTMNMGSFDFGQNMFVFGDRFLSDVSKRRLEFNQNTDYPIISTLRVGKYTARGFKISKKTMFQLALAVNKLSINTWEELEDQLSGFYGVDVSELFDKSKDFSLDSAIDMLDEVQEDFDHKVELTHPTFGDLITSLRVQFKKEFGTKFYKKVNYKNGKINSVVYKSFEWKLDELVDGGHYGLWAFESREEAESYPYDGNAILEFEVAEQDRVELHGPLNERIKFSYGSEINIFGPVKVLSLQIICDNKEKQPAAPAPVAPVPIQRRGGESKPDSDIPW